MAEYCLVTTLPFRCDDHRQLVWSKRKIFRQIMSVFEIDAYAKRQNKCDGHFSMHIVAKKKIRMIRQQQRRSITVDQKILKSPCQKKKSISRIFSFEHIPIFYIVKIKILLSVKLINCINEFFGLDFFIYFLPTVHMLWWYFCK